MHSSTRSFTVKEMDTTHNPKKCRRWIPCDELLISRLFRTDDGKSVLGFRCGELEEVKENIRRYGNVGVCRFVNGYFEDSMPRSREPVAAAYLNVEFASSTRTCLKIPVAAYFARREKVVKFHKPADDRRTMGGRD